MGRLSIESENRIRDLEVWVTRLAQLVDQLVDRIAEIKAKEDSRGKPR